MPADNHQARSGICTCGGNGALAPLPVAAVLLRDESFVLLRDFVEMVLTYNCDFRKLFEKHIVHRRH